jgi:glycolate oxidase iron-sulfur subunit
MNLGLDDSELASCVQCGLCLPHCPTFRVTGDESASPRGRIALMRNVQWNDAPVDAAFLEAMDLCVQCRGCETACPSSVPFGKLMAETRAAAATVPWWQRAAYRVLPHHRLLLAGSTVLAGAQRLRIVPSRRLGLPGRLPLRRAQLHSTGTEVWLFTGCVMDAWQRDVHGALGRVLDAMGVGWRTPQRRRGSGCCGALHEHAGLAADAERYVEQALLSMPGAAPIVVDSAGCGAMLKQHTDRAVDVHEWLAANATRLPPRKRLAVGGASVVVQDPCHLRHAQRAHHHVRAALQPYVASLVELDDEGLCCGAGGAYSALHPREAAAIRARKLASIARTGAAVVASANPGCIWHLAAAGLAVRHPIELIDEAVRDG